MAIAIFSTWTTYGTWLPGDERGWFSRNGGLQAHDLMRKLEASLRMNDQAITLDVPQRKLVETTITDHCAIRQWTLHAVNCRTNHVHVVVTAPDRSIEIPREQFKSWTTRNLKKGLPTRKDWWTQRGWDEYIDDLDHLAAAIRYARDGQ